MAFVKGSLGDNQKVKEYTDGLEGRVDSAFKEVVIEKKLDNGANYVELSNGFKVITMQNVINIAINQPFASIFRIGEDLAFWHEGITNVTYANVVPHWGAFNAKIEDYLSGRIVFRFYNLTSTNTRDIKYTIIVMGY